jgi:hypothetical protein
MAEMILPGTYIDVRPEGLIAPGQISVGNIGVVGTAAKGPIGVPQLLGSMSDALQTFYAYDSWIDPATKAKRTNELTLTRALELAFDFGGTIVYAVRVASNAAAKAAYSLPSGVAPETTVVLTAKSEGTWANDGLGANVTAAVQDAYVKDELHLGTEAPIALKHTPKQSARNRITHRVDATGITHTVAVSYDGDPAPVAGQTPPQAQIDRATGHVTFADPVAAADTVHVSYVVDATHAATVTLRLGHAQEIYTVVDGHDLIAQVNDPQNGSAWVDSAVGTHPEKLPLPTPQPPNQLPVFAAFKGGANGEITASSDYQAGLDALLNQQAHIIVGAGQDDSFGNKLDAHVQKASTDAIKHDRIGIVGSRQMQQNNLATSFDQIIGHNLNSDRIIFVAPGMKTTDTPTGLPVTLPGAYSAAAFAGLLSSFAPQVSPTNKILPVDELETHFDSAHLTLLLENRVLAIESRQGFHVVRGITTTTASAFSQITTRRIVDYAKFGVRSAADPYVGLLNNERVRSALAATLRSFLAGMVEDEMLQSYTVSVTATRAQEIQGIVDVTLTLQPVFSIDFIKVTMFLQ